MLLEPLSRPPVEMALTRLGPAEMPAFRRSAFLSTKEGFDKVVVAVDCVSFIQRAFFGISKKKER
jgi:hypothetical protein